MGEIDYRIPLSIRPVQPQVQPISALEVARVGMAARGMRATELANQQAQQKRAAQAEAATRQAQQDFADNSSIVLNNVLNKRTSLATAQARLAQLAPTPEHQAWVASLTPENLRDEVASIPISRELMMSDPSYRAQVAGAEAAARRLTPQQEAERARAKAEAVQPLMMARERARGEIAAERAGVSQERAAAIQAAAQDRAIQNKLKVERIKTLQPSGEERKHYRTLLSAQEANQSLLDAMDDPKVQGIIGTIFEDPRAFGRRLAAGRIPEAATDEQRKFLADLAYAAGQQRRQLVGMAQTSAEMKNLIDFLPAKGDTAPALRAKLEAIRDGLNREESAFMTMLEEFGVRGPRSRKTRPAPRRPGEGSSPPPSMSQAGGQTYQAGDDPLGVR